MKNNYIPVASEILDIIKHTKSEWTFRTKTNTEGVKPGQFYEISLPKRGESPISVSGIGENYIDFTIRNVGKVTGILFDHKVGDKLFIRGPYGNGFDINNYKGRDLVVVAGGSAIAPVRGIIQHVYNNPQDFKSFKLIVGFKSPDDILFANDLQMWSEKLDIVVTVDDAPEGYQGNVGLVTKYIPELKFEDLSEVSAVVVGPPMMMKFAVAEFLKLDIAEKDVWVSYERNMHCGLGKCGHCKMDSTYICLDGPVFSYDFAKTLQD
ncbi:anaerobic sulfite reductase subunit AsrB [Peptostreptococcus equinus]|uniref:Anaerobic sulfite reductase subunit AsrB n=1 Tax=Peptostreptococcus equinus TaxID=3003601 RepID=A0ABY7JPU0_9FIRM|nr:anaerobic sulfite reductase subunit AsrB [Peptostreptococcus sp. CBA3647]WAW14506.1 anaerobic sulfite reductase subunit AsrB [Peptostreptococcus sp. CBA3647]